MLTITVGKTFAAATDAAVSISGDLTVAFWVKSTGAPTTDGTGIVYKPNINFRNKAYNAAGSS